MKKKEEKEEKEEKARSAEQAEQPVPEESAAAANAAPEESAQAEDKTAEELKQARAEADDYKRKWYSVTAEYENYRKRTAGDSARRYREGRADVVKGLFPIADNLERALASCADEGTRKGISMVLQSFSQLLKEEQIETIDPLGKPFDAEESEAIMATEPEDGEESGIVKQVYRKGYKQNGKVLRYAQVVVIK